MPAPPVRPLRLVPRPSDRASPEIRIAIEPFYAIARELLPLFRKHWRELAVHKDVVPLDPNWDLMMQQSVHGVLHVLTVRADDVLVGYIFTIVSPHTHYKSTLHALIDMFWLDPKYRKGWLGMRMFRENEKHLQKLGVVRVIVSEKLHWLSGRDRRVRVIFRRLGLKAFEVVYTKLLVD